MVEITSTPMKIRVAPTALVYWGPIQLRISGSAKMKALRVFPPEVAHGLEAYARPELERDRGRYARRLEALLERLFAGRPFDAFVAPSDVFFFLRAAPQACHRLGVPFFVAQKETTISPQTMREHAPRVARWAPPIADHMTVCSERHRQFWLRAGGDPERIEVTGQPRFDYYVGGSARGAPGDPTVLFLSYHVDAYHPSEGSGEPVWAKLHRETERALWQLAERGWRVVIKPHPQQLFDQERRRIAGETGRLLGDRVILAGGDEDTRGLIASADVVLGFQTTALLEALIADRPVVYTAWDDEALRLSDELIPFHEWPDLVDVVTDADSLVGTVEAARSRGGRAEAARARVEEQLGPVDGRASERTLAAISRCVEEHACRRAPEVEERRRRLARKRSPLDLGHKARSGVQRVRSAVVGGPAGRPRAPRSVDE
jgi:hypothetical protein